MTTISIIINNFNYARFLGDAIESALDQTYPSVEVIVVDDGSTDDSRAVINGYGDRVLSVFKENGGQGSAYNAGYAICSGDIITFLDADDTLFPTAAVAIAQAFQQEPVVKVQWPLVMTDATGFPTGELSTKRPPPDGDLRGVVEREGPIYDFLFHTGNAYSRTFLDEILPVPEAPYRNGADMYVYVLAPVKGKIRTVPETLGTYRGHGSNNYRGRLLDESRIRNYLSRFESNASAVASHLAKCGVTVDQRQWRERNFNYLWPSRLLVAIATINSSVPTKAQYILINQEEWDGNVLTCARAMPFPQRDGTYWGLPADDDTAIAQLERAKKGGVEYVVIWWTCFWWLDYYCHFSLYLTSHSRLIEHNESVKIFALNP